jgi:hypothetical protein
VLTPSSLTVIPLIGGDVLRISLEVGADFCELSFDDLSGSARAATRAPNIFPEHVKFQRALGALEGRLLSLVGVSPRIVSIAFEAHDGVAFWAVRCSHNAT